MAKLPSMQFYPGDWLKDANLRRCCPAARGIWIDMICLMFDSPERGVLIGNGKPWKDAEIIQAISGCTKAILAELLDKGVAHRREKDNALFSPRLVRDEDIRIKRGVAGSAGGKKSLNNSGWVYAAQRSSDGAIKLGASSRPDRRSAELCRYLQGDDSVEMLVKWGVTNMAMAESVLHSRFANSHIKNEWFDIQPGNLDGIGDILERKGLRKRCANEAQTIAQIPEEEDEDEDVSLNLEEEREERGAEKSSPEKIIAEFSDPKTPDFWGSIMRWKGAVLTASESGAWKIYSDQVDDAALIDEAISEAIRCEKIYRQYPMAIAYVKAVIEACRREDRRPGQMENQDGTPNTRGNEKDSGDSQSKAKARRSRERGRNYHEDAGSRIPTS